MLKIAAIAFMPIAAVVFGTMAVLLAMIPGLREQFALAAATYYGMALLSFIIAAPLAWMVAWRMLSRREKRAVKTLDMPASKALRAARD